MKICIDDGSTNIKLAWTENGERRKDRKSTRLNSSHPK